MCWQVVSKHISLIHVVFVDQAHTAPIPLALPSMGPGPGPQTAPPLPPGWAPPPGPDALAHPGRDTFCGGRQLRGLASQPIQVH